MLQKSRVRFLPVVMLPSVMSAVLVPTMNHHVPDYVLGGTVGVLIGLAIVGLAWMVRGNSRCSTDE